MVGRAQFNIADDVVDTFSVDGDRLLVLRHKAVDSDGNPEHMTLTIHDPSGIQLQSLALQLPASSNDKFGAVVQTTVVNRKTASGFEKEYWIINIGNSFFRFRARDGAFIGKTAIDLGTNRGSVAAIHNDITGPDSFVWLAITKYLNDGSAVGDVHKFQ